MTRIRQRKIGNRANRTKITVIPIATVILGSMVAALPIITDYPILPPLGLLFLLAWRLLHTGIWPVWIGCPLGFVDDIFSGQPVGSAIFLWSIIMIALELFDQRSASRDYIMDWLLAGIAILVAIFGGAMVIDPTDNWRQIPLLLPQILLSLLLFPFIARWVAFIDRWRLTA